MVQKIRHIIHIIVSFITDYLSLLGRPLFYQFQFQRFRKEIIREPLKRVCILGNGPSINIIADRYENLKETDICTVNLSMNNDLFFRLKPKMYVIVDFIFWTQTEKEDIKKVWENVHKINWDIDIYLPFNIPINMKKAFEKNSFVKVHRYANNQWEPESKSAKQLKMFLYKQGLVSPNGSNVSIGAIFCALSKGYKEINLLGVEHSWMKDIRINDKNEVVLVDKHFYGEKEHVWLDYDGKPIRLVDFLASQLSTFTAHMNLRSYADYLSAKIINRTKGSYIDAYDRGDIEGLFQ